MINFNGNIVEEENLLTQNRAFLFGDGVFETVKIINNKILFLEDHYFRLMASMRVVRMEIPMNFTMEHFEEQILNLVQQKGISASARARITVFRNDGGLYLPKTNEISYLIHASQLESTVYALNTGQYEVDLYKDFYVTKQLLSSIKTTNKMINVTGSIFAYENGLANCLLINDAKNVVEGLQGNLFMLAGKKLITPPISEGCLNGIMRKQILALAKKVEGIEVVEEIISPFDLQKADELFLTNVIMGIQPITKYRKKEFTSNLAHLLVQKLNESITEN
ncbi:aminotransferase class IV [Flavobacterium johnsoniae]|uniref:branched-chain-amino-acid transaminase n=1 Tax=Flavobacterium johnsoniae (strain ATCC 17061 / DSM 2064 / JCM 8514 / BCRC 14874 / CCUG 350202 / NBRC 14942 / NCIMB 11054 / UW101) TaxID=376686 RepID=A5FNP0_FLAJ1|nr:aminotransferase class IV [Flavobacterium johnsoniae]ABQ03179.1 branched chain amino acid: 2-keto-4-methylthiobutyrate aminotransferase [Flavobacterium johnsoniae UW101]OXG01393.1 aminotransferase class IV [Flavobacterium johnsoniae UW101]WQG79960.1 aminotransferase class IV [Flavobacterium johnsoniae UW101]SHL82927.1 branched-chain amino acid aminotransferase [Flavobacterium johnsoniae]